MREYIHYDCDHSGGDYDRMSRVSTQVKSPQAIVLCGISRTAVKSECGTYSVCHIVTLYATLSVNHLRGMVQ